MKPDRYTKIVLTVIAFMLIVIACKSVVSPERTAQAQGPLANVQYSGPGVGYTFFDTHTGELWFYTPAHDGFKVPGDLSSGIIRVPPSWEYFGMVVKLGQPLAGAPK
jgi:hypothetical protein